MDEVLRRQIDDLDVVGPVDDGIGHGLAHPHLGDLRDDIVQAVDVLDVYGCVDVDSGRKQLLHVEVALWMPASLGVAVRQLVDQDECRAARQDRVEIHLLKHVTPVLDIPAGDDLKPGEQRLGFGAAMRFDHADHDIDALALAALR